MMDYIVKKIQIDTCGKTVGRGIDLAYISPGFDS